MLKFELGLSSRTLCVVIGQPRVIRTFLLAFGDLDPVDPEVWVFFERETSLVEGHAGAWEFGSVMRRT